MDVKVSKWEFSESYDGINALYKSNREIALFQPDMTQSALGGFCWRKWQTRVNTSSIASGLSRRPFSANKRFEPIQGTGTCGKVLEAELCAFSIFLVKHTDVVVANSSFQSHSTASEI